MIVELIVVVVPARIVASTPSSPFPKIVLWAIVVCAVDQDQDFYAVACIARERTLRDGYRAVSGGHVQAVTRVFQRMCWS